MWAYLIKAETQSDFERIYGPNSDWVQLFKKSEGYLGTELHRDVANGLRDVTLDYWVSKEARDAFRQQFAQAFAALDRRGKKCMFTKHSFPYRILTVELGEAIMPTKTVEVQQKYLKELLALVVKGTEVILTQGNTPIARLVPIAASPATPRVAGLHQGAIWISDDFDEPL